MVFWRIFKYVWPQWPRLIIIVLTALLISILLSLSFMTVVPLLKVMMGEEGLHGWIDREICDWRYGIEFYVPDITDFTTTTDQLIAYHLRVTDVDTDGFAEKAGIKQDDRIVGAGSALSTESTKVSNLTLLEQLATSPSDSITTVQVQRMSADGKSVELNKLQLQSGKKPFYIEYIQSVLGFVPRDAARNNKERAVAFIIVAMGIATIIRCLAKFYQQYLAEKVVQLAVARLREEAFSHAMTMPVGFFATKGTSDIISRLIGDISGTGKGVKVLLGKALREPLTAASCLGCAMLISFKLTLIFLCAAPPTIYSAFLLGKKIRKAARKSLRNSALILARVRQAVSSLRVVKVYNREDYESAAYQVINRKLLKQMLKVAKVDAATGPVMEVLGMLAGSAALLLGARWVTSARLQPTYFFGLLVLLGTAAESVRKCSDLWNSIQEANAASERAFAVVDEPREFQNPVAFELGPLERKIEFKDVFFTYPNGTEPTLKGINLTVNAGQTVALVGPNGSGKTTLVNLIPRFYNPDAGSILIDGQDICNATLKSLRSQIAIVTQEVITFNDTVAANIGYSRPGATKEEIIEAAQRSYAHEFIKPLPQGYDTIIGEHGSGFSGGQLQRIIIARAILKNPAILIFDEATSQVDADSESKIHKAINEVMESRTCFIIAHRFSTVLKADSIVVIDKGRIVAQGRHDDLTKSCRLYQNLYETQVIKTDY